MVTNAGVKTELITTGEAAKLLHVHMNTIRRWANDGVLKAFRIGGRGDRRFVREDVENLLIATDAVETKQESSNG